MINVKVTTEMYTHKQQKIMKTFFGVEIMIKISKYVFYNLIFRKAALKGPHALTGYNKTWTVSAMDTMKLQHLWPTFNYNL